MLVKIRSRKASQLIEVLSAPVTAPPPHQAPIAARNRLRALSQLLFGWRTSPGFGWIETSVLALYCSLLAVAIPKHEPWSDEAQAWLLAHDNSLWQIVRYRLHYEGAPPLWHIILKIFQHAGGSYAGMAWLGAALAAAGVFVMLRWSPFPLVIRVLLPFTFFFAYQYAVIARSYNAFPLIAFSLCALYGRRSRLLWFALVAGLLANIAMQGAELAAGLSLLYAWDLYRSRRRADAPSRKRLLSAVAIYAAMAAVGFYAAIPAPDVNFAVTGATGSGKVHRLLVRVIGETRPMISPLPPRPAPYVPPIPEDPMPSLRHSPAAWVAWQIDHRPHDARGFQSGDETATQSAAEFFLSFLSEATWPLSTSNVLACVFLALLCLWLRARRSLRFILPWIALMLIGLVVWVADHHMGMIFTALLAAIWIAAARNPWNGDSTRLDLAFTSVFALMLALQIGWTASCIRRDLRGNYDPGRETAAWLHAHPVPRTAAFNFWSTSIQPYFARNPFFNLPTRYRLWSWNANPDFYYQEIVDQHPDRIVYSAEFPGPGLMRNQWAPMSGTITPKRMATMPWDQGIFYFHTHGYVETHRFCGKRFSRLSYSYINCDLILEPVKPVPGPPLLEAASTHQPQHVVQ